MPHTLYRLFGNMEVLSAQYESKKRWLGFVQRRARRTGLFSRHRFSPHRKLIVDTGYHWGEWLEPGHDMGKDVLRNTVVPDAELSRNVKAAYRDAFTNDGIVESDPVGIGRAGWGDSGSRTVDGTPAFWMIST